MRIFYTTILFLFMNLTSGAVCTNSGTSLSATTTVSNIYCTTNDGVIIVNAINGWIDLAAANGTGYSYSITAGPLTRPTQSSNIFNALPVGTYTIKITDCNGSTINVNATVGGTAPTAITYSPTVYKSICQYNNAVKISPSGGRSPYTISVTTAPAGSSPIIKGDTIYGLGAGTLNALITDACGATLGVSTTISTNYPLPTNQQSYTNYSGCSGTRTDVYFPSADSTYIRYQLISFPSGTNLVADSFYTQLYFNGTLMQVKSPSVVGDLFLVNGGFFFSGYGPGVYTIRTFAKCAGLVKTDSLIIGNRPASPTGTNTNLGTSTLPTYSRLGCTDFDFKINGFSSISGVLTKGTYLNVMEGKFKVKILSGASHVGDSAYSTMVSTEIYATMTNLAYSATPYVIEISDTCGNKDTVTFTRNALTFTKRPTATYGCPLGVYEGYNRIMGSVARYAFYSPSVPTVYPIKYTYLSSWGANTSTPIWTNYPITVVDSVGPNAPIQNIPNPSTIIVAYENGCGEKDTTVWTMSCTPSPVPVFTTTVVPKCGDKADITMSRTITAMPSSLNAYSTPSGAASIFLPDALSTKTTTNQPAGTYYFRGFTGISGGPLGGSATTYIAGPGFSGYATALQTTNASYPISNGTDQKSVLYSGAIDTAKLRLWDTLYTVVAPSTALSVTATESYLCKDGTTTANIMAKASGSAPPRNFMYSVSTVGSTGPWSTPQADSLLNLTGITGVTPIWVRVTDVCSSTAITNTTVGYLVSATSSICDGAGIATFTPNPYTNSFIYTLKNPSGVSTNYSYGTPITVDLSSPTSAGTYYLYYKLASSGSTGCIVDSIKMNTTSPCFVVLALNLIEFSSSQHNNFATIRWTVSDAGNSIYELQKSVDAQNWSSVTTIISKNSGVNQYSHNDYLGDVSTTYYRLKIKNQQGEINYSKTEKIIQNLIPKSLIISAFPNPYSKETNSEFTITINQNGDYISAVYDYLGREIVLPQLNSINELSKTIKFSLHHLNSGIYQIKIINKNSGEIHHQKLIIK